jgi:YidC/Oxa1 family membrane protein insertase
MANQRLFLWAALGLVLWLVYQAWMQDYHPRAVPAQASLQTTPLPGTSAPAPGKPLDQTVPGLPAASESSTESSLASAPSVGASIPPGSTATESTSTVHVLTDVLDLDIGLKGGDLERDDLPRYPKQKNQPNVPVRLFEDVPGRPRFVFQSGLTAGASASGAQPDHLANFSSLARSYVLADGQQELKVPLTWSDGHGLTVTKTFTFKRGSYAIPIDYQVRNEGSQDWRAASYLQFLRQDEHVERSMWNVETYSFKGPAIYDGTRYRKLKLDKAEDASFAATVTGGWIASMQHHFVAAAVPSPGKPYQFRVEVKDGEYLLSAEGPTQVVPAGTSRRFSETVYVGPKLQAQLEATAPKLELTADYGNLTLISKPLFQLLDWVHRVVGNWGWAIIIVTALIKLAFYPLSEASGRSMAKMRTLAPRIKNIQERYKDDREQLGRAMMEVYKREKINPLAGCLPMIVQIPVFLAFYWMLLENVEMRQAPFMLWINDLSSRDPLFILPLLMGAAMFGQYKLNPAPPDPMQAKIFMFMPIVMTAMFAWFPAGLVLYWLTNTLLSIAQQWNINRRIEMAQKKS